jgi:superfamily II DNA/RNA helicase
LEEGDDEEEEDDESEDDSEDGGKRKKKNWNDYKIKEDVIDDAIIRREATVIELVKKLGMNRVIIFFNEKKECERMLTLFTIYGFKCV